MLLFDNPFYLLKSGPEDDRKTLTHRAEELSLSLEGTEEALAVLTNPRRRLAAELAWLPGLGPERRQEVLSLLNKSEVPRPKCVKDLPPLAFCNVAAAILGRHPLIPDDLLFEWALVYLPWAFEYVRISELMDEINVARDKSGFSRLNSIEMVAEELKNNESRYLSAIFQALDTRSTAKVIMLLTDMIRKENEDYIPSLNLRLIEAYEGEALNFFEEESAAVETLCAKLEKLADFRRLKAPLTDILACLWRSTSNWAYVARPLLLAAMHQGITHEKTEEMAARILNLSSELNNEFRNHRLGDYLNNILLALFPHLDVSEIARGNKKIFISHLGLSGGWPLKGETDDQLPIRRQAKNENGLSGLARLSSGLKEAESCRNETLSRDPKPPGKLGAFCRNFVTWLIVISIVKTVIRFFQE